MLSTPTTTLTTIILDLLKDNWSTWHQALKFLYFTKFGVAGQQIFSDTLIPLQPFAAEPTTLDLDIDAAGLPIPGQYTYTRRTLTAEEIALPPVNRATLSLSTQGNTNYRDAKRRFSDHDTECLDHLYRHLSPASHTSIKTHVDYPPTNFFEFAPAAMHSTPWLVVTISPIMLPPSFTGPTNM